MSDDEIVKQNRDTLLERMNESGNAYSDEYPYGLMGEAEEEIKLLRKERDEARRMWCEAAPVGNSLSVNDMDLRARAEAKRRGWDCFKEEEMACDTLSQEVSQEGSKLPITISSNGIRITEYIPPQNSVREIPPYGAYTTGECTLSVHTIKKTQ